MVERVVRTACQGCMSECGAFVYVEDGKVTKIEGDIDHPLNNGFLCPIGLSYPQLLYHPDRLRYPLKRVGERGEGKWERVTWDEALNSIAKRMTQIKEKYGPQSITYTYGTYPKNGAIAFCAFLRALGSASLFIPDAHYCFSPHIVADVATFGVVTSAEYGQPDYRNSKCILLWGHNPLASFPPKGKQIIEAKAKGARLIIIDPRCTELASRADLWLRVRPATDAALAMGIINVIIKEQLYDKEFVGKWCTGFEQLEARTRDFDPKRVSEITWVPEEQIVEAARIYASVKPATCQAHTGTSMIVNSVQTCRAISILIALTGNLDIMGGNQFASYDQPARTYLSLRRILRLPSEAEEKQFGREKYPLLAGPKSIRGMNHPPTIIKAMLTDEPYPVKALWNTCNLLTSFEDGKQVLEALKKLDLLVVMDFFLQPTAEFADFVLPAATWIEVDNICDSCCYPNFIAARQKAIEPLYECRDDNEVAFDLIGRMGLEFPLPVRNFHELLDWRLKPIGLTFEEFKTKGYEAAPIAAKKYEKGLLREDGKLGFNTPTGKVELASSLLEENGYDPLPYYEEPYESPLVTPELYKEFPLILITGARHICYYQSMGHNIPMLREKLPHPITDIHPETAKDLGIVEGDWVWIETPRGKGRVRQKARFTPSIHPSVIHAQAHWWYPEEIDRDKRIWEANVNVLTSMDPPYDPIIGSTMLRGGLCKVRKAE